MKYELYHKSNGVPLHGFDLHFYKSREAAQKYMEAIGLSPETVGIRAVRRVR